MARRPTRRLDGRRAPALPPHSEPAARPARRSPVRRTLTLLCGLAGLMPATTRAAATFEFQDGDRVVLIGDAFIERDQTDGYLETLLTAAHPDMTITFRNLGWSGDTVAGIAPAGFGPPEDGFRNLTRTAAECGELVLR